jgi:hypothetical protein
VSLAIHEKGDSGLWGQFLHQDPVSIMKKGAAGEGFGLLINWRWCVVRRTAFFCDLTFRMF